MAGVDFRVNVAVGGEDVGPAVVVDVEEHGAPAQLVGIDAQAGWVGDVVVRSVAARAVEGGGGRVAGHVDVRPAVFVGVDRGDGEAVVATGFGEAALHRDIFELAV